MSDRPTKKISNFAIQKVGQLLANFQMTEKPFRIAEAKMMEYIDGLKEGMGLEGSYDLNVSTWTFTPKEPPSAVVAEAENIAQNVETLEEVSK